MKRMTSLGAAAILAIASAAAAQVPVARPLEKVAARAASALARLEYKVANELIGEQRRFGQAVCIDATRGMFVTGDVSATIPAGELKEFALIPPGTAGKGVSAKLLGTDPEEGLTFLAATGPHKWSELKFSSSTALKVGQRVVSVGLLEPSIGNPVYMGVAVISAKLRLPGEFVAVTGGTLTNQSSPVMAMDGRVVGLVRGQLGAGVQLLGRGMMWNETRIRELRHTRGFVPSNEFMHVIADFPARGGPRKMPWLGAVTYEPLTELEVTARPGLQGRPGVIVGRVIPNSPASKGGIKQSDAIVGLGGRPVEDLPSPRLVAANFRRLLSRYKPGDKVKVTIVRDSREETHEVTLTERPPLPHEAKRYYSAALGFAARNMVTWDQYIAPATFKKNGVPITAVQQGKPVAGELRPGDLITAVNKRRVRTVDELGTVLGPAAKGSSPITFMVLRQGVEQSVVVLPPGSAGLPGG